MSYVQPADLVDRLAHRRRRREDHLPRRHHDPPRLHGRRGLHAGAGMSQVLVINKLVRRMTDLQYESESTRPLGIVPSLFARMVTTGQTGVG